LLFSYNTITIPSTLASKRNPIAVLTGLSHERLQLFHRWCAFFMLILGLIHTFAFVRSDAKAGTSKEMWAMSSSYWTGVAMLVPQIWLTFMSVAPIRWGGSAHNYAWTLANNSPTIRVT